MEKVFDPVEHLEEKKAHYEKGYNTMEVFDSLPSMYTKDKWEALQKKRRCDLNFENLYWLSRYDPKPTDGHHLEDLINKKVYEARNKVMGTVNPLITNYKNLNYRLGQFSENMNTFRNEVVNISKLRSDMSVAVDEYTDIKSQVQSIDLKLTDTLSRLSNMSLSYAKRIGEQEAKLSKLDIFVHKPNNFLSTLKRECEKIDTRLTLKMEELLSEA